MFEKALADVGGPVRIRHLAAPAQVDPAQQQSAIMFVFEPDAVGFDHALDCNIWADLCYSISKMYVTLSLAKGLRCEAAGFFTSFTPSRCPSGE